MDTRTYTSIVGDVGSSLHWRTALHFFHQHDRGRLELDVVLINAARIDFFQSALASFSLCYHVQRTLSLFDDTCLNALRL